MDKEMMQDNLHFLSQNDYSGTFDAILNVVFGNGFGKGFLIILFIVPALLFIYFLPSYLARKYNDNYRTVFYLNIATGWTILGRVGCLILAIYDKE